MYNILPMETDPEILTVPFIKGLFFLIEDYLVAVAMAWMWDTYLQFIRESNFGSHNILNYFKLARLSE